MADLRPLPPNFVGSKRACRNLKLLRVRVLQWQISGLTRHPIQGQRTDVVYAISVLRTYVKGLFSQYS